MTWCQSGKFLPVCLVEIFRYNLVDDWFVGCGFLSLILHVMGVDYDQAFFGDRAVVFGSLSM